MMYLSLLPCKVFHVYDCIDASWTSTEYSIVRNKRTWSAVSTASTSQSISI